MALLIVYVLGLILRGAPCASDVRVLLMTARSFMEIKISGNQMHSFRISAVSIDAAPSKAARRILELSCVVTGVRVQGSIVCSCANRRQELIEVFRLFACIVVYRSANRAVYRLANRIGYVKPIPRIFNERRAEFATLL